MHRLEDRQGNITSRPSRPLKETPILSGIDRRLLSRLGRVRNSFLFSFLFFFEPIILWVTAPPSLLTPFSPSRLLLRFSASSIQYLPLSLYDFPDPSTFFTWAARSAHLPPLFFAPSIGLRWNHYIDRSLLGRRSSVSHNDRYWITPLRGPTLPDNVGVAV